MLAWETGWQIFSRKVIHKYFKQCWILVVFAGIVCSSGRTMPYNPLHSPLSVILLQQCNTPVTSETSDCIDSVVHGASQNTDLVCSCRTTYIVTDLTICGNRPDFEVCYHIKRCVLQLPVKAAHLCECTNYSRKVLTLRIVPLEFGFILLHCYLMSNKYKIQHQGFL